MKARWTPVVGLALVISGCTVGPKYTRPPAPVPAAFKGAPPDSFKETKDRKIAQPGTPSLPAKWWETFGDPQLTALEEQGAAGNQDLKIAEARFRDARLREARR
jgi:outer membrane protein TolC